MSDTFAVEVFDPSLLITNLGKFERVVPGDRIGRCENFSYIGGDEGWSGDEQHSENEKPEPQSSPSSSEKRISNKHTLIYRMFHVTPNLQPSGKPFSPKQQGRSSEEGGGGGRFEHGGRWSGDNTKMRVREGSHLNPGGELVQNRQHGILRVLGNYVESGQNGPSSPPSSSSVEIGPAGSSQEFLAAVVNPTVKLKGREGLHHSRSEGELLSKDLVVTTKVKSSDPAFPKHYPTESSPTTRRFSSGSKNVNNNNASEPESPHKPNSPSHQHNIFYRMFYEHHDGENHTKKINNNNHPTNSSSTPKSSRRLSINNKHHGGGDHHPVQHHSIFKDLIETGNKVKRSRSLDKIGKLTRSQSDASLSEKYGECQEVLGKGAHAVVQLAHKKDTFCREKLYAVKRFRKRPKDEHPKEHIKKLTAEFCIASTLHHENVCETVDLIQDENENWCEVMEYCPGGDLYTRIKAGPMNQLEIDCFFKQLIHGLAYIHSMGVAHS